MTSRRLLIAAVAAIALATSAATAADTYKLDAKGKCHNAATGQFAKQSLCATPTPAPAPKHCRDPKSGKFEKCSAAGAVPA
jgi:hypothetical protein